VLTTGGEVMCWGANYYGQLGLGKQDFVLHPIPTLVPGLTDVVEVVASPGSSFCARKQDGSVLCWGWNFYGQLGDGTLLDRYQPTAIPELTDVVGLSLVNFMSFHACAVKKSGKVVCWGRNEYGQLGDGTTTPRNSPAEVVGLSDVVAVATGFYHTCAVTKLGQYTCWGRNEVGQLRPANPKDAVADKDDVAHPLPEPSYDTVPVQAIAAGGYHTCVISKQEGVKCFGYNGSGQLGSADTKALVATPVPYGATYPVAFATTLAEESTHVIMSDGSVLAWGWNGSACQLGAGILDDKVFSPTKVADLTDVVQVAGAIPIVCAITGTGSLFCWGSVHDGMLPGVKEKPVYCGNSWLSINHPLQISL